MFAVFISGGKQHKVRNGELVTLEKLDLGIGDKVTFDQVLMLSDGKETQVGTPHLSKKTVIGEVVEQNRAKKVRIIKFRRRKHHMKRQGHRQYQTVVRIVEIAGVTWQKSSNNATADKKKVSAKPAETKKASADKKVEAKTEAKATKKVSAAKKPAVDKVPAAEKAPAKKEIKAAEKKAESKKAAAPKKKAAPKKSEDK